MRNIITTTSITLDGVMQAPGGPEEDRSDGFAYGDWQFGESGDVMAEIQKLKNQMVLTCGVVAISYKRFLDITS